ncbi:hypothetical protein C8J42_102541 [Sphingomonas sp. PP-CE-1A-559]|uniref:hypothetical protein n=1 Tax=Sphingomonas sp. PP-CE-1A-559 TaxID=2135657 RepID=UPI001056B921|nr:hypothetical protein [Sphingomonas sp. PP-CE-1A-559]TCP92765.1 hypothetical protein C8J42_102541 [Sphingomonas sp. PP-CE-1A-559]
MSKDTALVYWIEADTGALCVESMGPNDIRGSGSFRSEVILKLGRNPIDITTIYYASAGNEWEKAEVERLKVKAEQMREAISNAEGAKKCE